MTKEEAINILAWMPENFNMLGAGCVGEREAIKMSIEALKAEPEHGEWISLTPQEFLESGEIPKEADYFYMCSECKQASRFIAYDLPYKFCPNCGRRMLTKESPETLSLKESGDAVSKGGETNGDTD